MDLLSTTGARILVVKWCWPAATSPLLKFCIQGYNQVRPHAPSYILQVKINEFMRNLCAFYVHKEFYGSGGETEDFPLENLYDDICLWGSISPLWNILHNTYMYTHNAHTHTHTHTHMSTNTCTHIVHEFTLLNHQTTHSMACNFLVKPLVARQLQTTHRWCVLSCFAAITQSCYPRKGEQMVKFQISMVES